MRMPPIFLMLFGGLGIEQFINWVSNAPKNSSSIISEGFSDMSSNYLTRSMSAWTFAQVKKSEGLKESAYYATDDERSRGISTIGYGTCYYFLDNGNAFNRSGNNKVLPTDTLSKVKNQMGFDNLTNAQFAERLILNHSFSKSGSYPWLANQLTTGNIPYNEKVKAVLQDWAYGSGSIKNLAPKLTAYSAFINSLKTKDINNVAARYCYLRYEYYKKFTGSAWGTAKIGWMLRVYYCGMYLKGVEVKNAYASISYDSKQRNRNLRNIEKIFKRDLGIILDMGS